MRKIDEHKWLTSFYTGRKCIFCGHRHLIRTRRGYLKCVFCNRQKSFKRLKRELIVLSAFRRQQTARLTALDLNLDYKAVKRIYNRLRLAIVRSCEAEGRKLLSGQIELDEAYFGGRRKGKRGRGAAGKSIVFGLLERNGRIYTKVVDGISAPVLLDIIKQRTRKGSVYFSDQFRGYNSLKRYGKHLTIKHTKQFARRSRKYHSHINGIEGFWSFAKHGLYNYRGVSKSNFPLYLKEMEWRYNHRGEPVLPLLVKVYYSGYEVT